MRKRRFQKLVESFESPKPATWKGRRRGGSLQYQGRFQRIFEETRKLRLGSDDSYGNVSDLQYLLVCFLIGPSLVATRQPYYVNTQRMYRRVYVYVTLLKFNLSC